MSTHLSDSHEHFDFLCALSASGWITSDERETLRAHLTACRACRQAVGEYGNWTQVLSERSGKYVESVPEGMYGRFRARASNHENQLQEVPEPPRPQQQRRLGRLPWHIFVRPGVMATALLFICVIVAQFINHVQPKQPGAASSTAAQPSSSELALRDQVRNLQQKQNELTEQIQKEEGWLRKASTDREGLAAQITALQKQTDDGRNRELQAEADMQRLKRQLEEAQMEQTTAQNNNALNIAQITELKNRISAVQLELTRERRLSSSLQEMRDLMENREVRVIQLGTVNQGKRVRAFGRAFYVPGHKLVLFAYDLSDPEALSAHAFYVWGDRPGTPQPAQVLGTLTLEDQKDSRWAIRIESPDVFSKISEIFITMESSTGKVEKPTGQPMLLTSLTKSTP